MGQLEDIDKLRKKRNRKQNFKRLGIFLLVIALFFAGWQIWQNIKQTSLAERVLGGMAEWGSGEGYPMEYSSTTIRQIDTMGNTLLVLTDTHLHIYNKNGKELRQVQHGLSNPIMTHSDSRIVLYDNTSTSLRVESKTQTVKEMQLDYPVLFATISPNNSVAVITNAQRYLGKISVYDASMEQPVFSWLSAESYLYGAQLSSDGKSLAVSSVQTTGGDLVSALTLYRLDEKDPFAQRSFPDEMIHSIHFQNSELEVLTDRGAYYYSEQGKEKGSVSFNEETLQMFCADNRRFSALVLGDYREFKSVKLNLMGESGTILADVSIKAQITKLASNDHYLAVYLDNRIQIYNEKGEMVHEITPEQEVLFLKIGGSYLYYVTPDAICQESLLA